MSGLPPRQRIGVATERDVVPLPSPLTPHGDARAHPTPSAWARWRLPAALIVLTLVPMTGGLIRLSQLTGGAEITPANARFIASPAPVALHIVCATVYCLLGALQFAPTFRRRRPDWHRAAGRLLIPLGLIAALSGLWMTVFYPNAPGDGALLAGIRLVVGVGMLASLVLGFTAIRRRDIASHRAWMIRGYAIGQGAGTQALTGLLYALFVGVPGEVTRAVFLMGGAWAINLVVAEWFIRKRPGREGAVRP